MHTSSTTAFHPASKPEKKVGHGRPSNPKNKNQKKNTSILYIISAAIADDDNVYGVVVVIVNCFKPKKKKKIIIINDIHRCRRLTRNDKKKRKINYKITKKKNHTFHHLHIQQSVNNENQIHIRF